MISSDSDGTQSSPWSPELKQRHSPVQCVCVCVLCPSPQGTHITPLALTAYASVFVVWFHFLALKMCEVVFALLPFKCSNLRRYSGMARYHPDPANTKTDSSVCVCPIFIESRHIDVDLPWQRSQPHKTQSWFTAIFCMYCNNCTCMHAFYIYIYGTW